MNLPFTNRADLSDFEWELTRSFQNRVNLEKDEIRKLAERSNLHGSMRLIAFTGSLILLAVGTLAAARVHWALAIPGLYAYWFLYGFWVAIAHELQHKMVFRASWQGISECIYFWVQALIWNSPCYARTSHRLHHRFTMVRDVDPETDWPEVITTKWLRSYLTKILLNVAIIGAPFRLAQDVYIQINRVIGKQDRMMRDHCSPTSIRCIRLESAAILGVHAAIALASIGYQTIWPILFITLAWQIGGSIEALWHSTEHIARAYNVNDQRLATRSVRVSPLIRILYGGLDDHVDHHLFPAVPSMNLPKLHRLLHRDLAPTRSMINCWREMFAIAREKDQQPQHEYVPITPTPRPGAIHNLPMSQK